MRIIAITLRNYKCYQGTQLIKFFSNDEKFIGFIGESGILGNVAPTLLEILEIEKPKDMVLGSLIERQNLKTDFNNRNYNFYLKYYENRRK